MSPEIIAQMCGMVVAAMVATWVATDALRRGLQTASAIGWAVGVFMVMIVFLPIYLWMRKDWTTAPKNEITRTKCPYCDYFNTVDANFCAKCQRMLKSSDEIHRS